MTTIEFYYDPSCPFCWITSRWLLDVQKHRELNIAWRQFSLALKNDELDASTPDKSPHGDVHRGSHRTHRVITAAVQQHNASAIELYSEFGIRYHIMEKPFDDDMIREVLAAKNLPAELLRSADDSSLDIYLQAELDSAIDAAGQDIGVPTIVFTDTDGARRGYFGPVLDALPDSLEESLNLWDGLEKLAHVSHFYELKRSREGSPNVFSAAKC